MLPSLPFHSLPLRTSLEFSFCAICSVTFSFFFIFTVCTFPPHSFHRLPIANLIAHPSLQLVNVPSEVHFVMAFWAVQQTPLRCFDPCAHAAASTDKIPFCPLFFSFSTFSSSCHSFRWDIGIIELFELQRTLIGHLVPLPCNEKGHPRLHQVFRAHPA